MYPRDARSKYTRSFPVVECDQCGEPLFAPQWSEPVDDRRVRHAWNCEACGYSFETTVCFAALESARGFGNRLTMRLIASSERRRSRACHRAAQAAFFFLIAFVKAGAN